ncbi:hypothetical protein BY458DRAFT_518693 [Sporodiniella umbellata]|nr:hypothetical protein BY458DRAFT_518693 [Sporodiniella umbellata]
MQQLIQQRVTTHSFLNKAKTCIHTWREVLSKSLAILNSMCNIVSQQKSSLEMTQLIEIHNVNQQSLLFKQTESLGDLIRKLRITLDLLKDVNSNWSRLQSDVNRFVSRFLEQPEIAPQPLSTESMLQVVAVDPIDLYGMVNDISYSYDQEYKYKYNLSNNISSYLSTPKDAYKLLELWQADSHIAKEVEQKLLERIQLFNVTKKVLESVD